MEQKTSKNLIITYGLLLGTVSILISVIKYVFSSNILDKSIIESVTGILITIALVVIPITIFKKENNSQLTLSQSLKIGMGVSAIAGVIGALYFFVFANYIQPDIIDKLMNMQIKEAMKTNPSMSAEQMQQGMGMAKKFIMPMFYTMVIITSLFFGFLTSLITGLALRKEQ
jgi:hypothetical protein